MSSSQCDPRCEDCGCMHCRCAQADRAAPHPLPGVPRAHYEGSFGQRLADAQRHRPLTVESAPIGTKAPACIGGYWIKVERGWKWCTGSTFPRPGGDWTGELIPPEPVAVA